MKKTLMILMLLLPWLWTASADNVSQQRAAEVASAFFRQAGSGISPASAPSLRMVLSSKSLPKTSGAAEPSFYVFDNASGPGFVIVAGDDAAMPVLGYSFESNFPEGRTLPPNLAGWLEGIGGVIEAARQSGAEPTEAVLEAWKTAGPGTTVREIETAKWNQETPYWNDCPVYYRNNTYTGCTATALAIVMRHHKWPERGTGTLPGYTTNSYQIQIDDRPLGHEYDWENMPLRYYDDYGSPVYNQAQAEAVATLMYDCAVLMKSDFGDAALGGTGAYTQSIPGPLMVNMWYDPEMRIVQKDDYGADQWLEMMKAEIDGNRPILYGGYTADGAGHSFVLDGYDSENYFRVNWGWGGMSDGYFLLDVLDPDMQGAGGSDAGFSFGQDAIIGLQPGSGELPDDEISYTRFDGKDENGLPMTYYGLSLKDGVAVEQNVPFVLYAGLLCNTGYLAINGLEIRFAVTDADGEVVEVLKEGSPGSEPLEPGFGYALWNEFVVKQPIGADYRIRGYFRSERTPDWTLIKNRDGNVCVWDLIIGEPEPQLSLEEGTSIYYDLGVIRISTLDGVTVSVLTESGQVLGSVQPAPDEDVELKVRDIPTDTCIIRLERGSEVKEFKIHI